MGSRKTIARFVSTKTAPCQIAGKSSLERMSPKSTLVLPLVQAITSPFTVLLILLATRPKAAAATEQFYLFLITHCNTNIRSHFLYYLYLVITGPFITIRTV